MLEGGETAAVDVVHNVIIVDYGAFANYIRKAVTILLPEENVVPPALNVALEDPDHQESIRKFLSDPQVSSLYIQRNCLKGKRKSESVYRKKRECLLLLLSSCRR